MLWCTCSELVINQYQPHSNQQIHDQSKSLSYLSKRFCMVGSSFDSVNLYIFSTKDVCRRIVEELLLSNNMSSSFDEHSVLLSVSILASKNSSGFMSGIA